MVPAFELRQYVFEELPWPASAADLDAVLAGGYSVSLFTTWAEPAIGQVWVKTRERLDPRASYFGATAATRPRHPVPGAPWQNCTEQLGVPGPSHERLPHFRLGFTPSSGAELQSEYAVPRKHGIEALRALRRLAELVSPVLIVSEIRAVRGDDLWLRPFHHQDSVAFDFTWKPRTDDVLSMLPRVEAALAPFGMRPHWGKLFAASPEQLAAVYPRLPDFRLVRGLDGDGKFRNEFIARTIFGEA